MSVEELNGEIERLLASVERSIQWLRRYQSDELVSLTAELQQTLDGIRGMLSGT